MLERLLGQSTAIVEIGDAELCMRYGLTVPVENEDALQKYKQAREFAAKITGGPLNGHLDPKRCRVISHSPDIKISLDTAWQILWQAALIAVAARIGGETTEIKQPAAAEPGPPPEPDRSQLETFVRAMFKHATAGNYVSLRAFLTRAAAASLSGSRR